MLPRLRHVDESHMAAAVGDLCRDAGVTNPSLNAKASDKRAPGGKPAKAAKTAKAAGKPVVPTITNDNELRAYVASQRVAMLATMAKASQCKKILPATASAIQDAMTILATIAPTA